MSDTFKNNAGASYRSSKSITTNVANTTGSIVVFTIAGTIQVLKIWGVVTTVLSAAHTAAYLRLNDQGATYDMTLNTGVALSAAGVGSTIVKKGLVGAALVLLNNANAGISEPTTLETEYFEEFIIWKKTGAVTTIDHRYTTTDNPSSGVIQYFMDWIPMSTDASVS